MFLFSPRSDFPIHLQTSTRISYRRTERRVRLRLFFFYELVINLWKSFNSTWFVHRVSSSFWLILTPTWLDATLCASRKIWCKFNIQEFTGKIEWGEGGLSKISITYCFFLNLNLQMCHWRHCLVALTVRRSVPGEMLFNVDFVSFGIQKLFCSSVQQFLERTQIFWLPCGCYMLLERKTCLCVCIMLTVLVIIYPTLKY